MIKPATLTIELNDLLKTEKTYEMPSWINECSADDQQLYNGDKQINYENINQEFNKLA